MKQTVFSKTLRTVGLTAMLSVMIGSNVQQTAQAQLVYSGEAYMPCSEAYFSDPDIMYASGSFDLFARLREIGQFEQFQQIAKPIMDEQNAILDELTTFYVALDAPVGYTPKEVNGEAVEIPAEIEQAIHKDMTYPHSREQVEMLTEKYGQYATFGQQLSLIFSSAQAQRYHELGREYNALVNSYVPEEQKQLYRELVSENAPCSVNYAFVDYGINSIVVEVGQRPELDARLRADTTGATLFR
jgi:hypothetical protein